MLASSFERRSIPRGCWVDVVRGKWPAQVGEDLCEAGRLQYGKAASRALSRVFANAASLLPPGVAHGASPATLDPFVSELYCLKRTVVSELYCSFPNFIVTNQ